MQEILEKLWQGKMEHPEYQIKEYRELAEQHVKAIGELESLLAEDMQEKLRQVIETRDRISAFCEQEAFKYGVRLGVQISREINDGKSAE